jgi:hypothetical protein
LIIKNTQLEYYKLFYKIIVFSKIAQMFLNIITPCSRPKNLHKISESINIPNDNYRWIVVMDLEDMPNQELIPSNCEVHLHKNPLSVFGNSQRNYALDLVQNGHVYFNDDDTTIHPELWDNIKDLTQGFISFSQNNQDGSLRLVGNEIKLYAIDSHNFIVDINVIQSTRFKIDFYDADGYFAVECYNKSSSKVFIPKVLSIYNILLC